ncbi:MAG: hypothetical protein JSW10_06105 [Pseudomonadota bacterium]|nr:MAG: hypothetical protein JSW10_06105 [Pseudomonadota bacterium]
MTGITTHARIALAGLMLAVVAPVCVAGESREWQANLTETRSADQSRALSPKIQFKHERLLFRDTPLAGSDLLFDPVGYEVAEELELGRTGGITQYDAAIAYPVSSRAFGLDLGVNFKHLDWTVVRSEGGTRSVDAVNETIPMLYANALYRLPSTGFAAGVEGSYSQYERHELADYRAKVSFTMDSGFGMQGGWRHQEFRLDDAKSEQFEYQHTGPFLDLYYRF